MITLLVGENSFEIERALADITNNFDSNVEKINGVDLQLSQLPDILMGVSLFATSRMIIIRNLSENKMIWPIFGDWILKISDDINLVLIESKLDKRTSTYKTLKNNVIIKDFQLWNDRDLAQAEKWVIAQAKTMNLDLDKKSVQVILFRVGVNQWQLFHALEKLSLTDKVSIETIENIIEPNPTENVFNLFETALRGDLKQLKQTLRNLEQSTDAYQLLGLLYFQVFQLAAVVSAQKTDNIAKDFGIHPYAVSKLSSIAKQVGNRNITKIVSIFAATDDEIKLSQAEPWLLIERALLKVASIKK